MTQKIAQLLEGLNLCSVPTVITEQYPKGLGATVESLATVIEGHSVVEKTCFSCMECEEFVSTLKALGKKQVIIAGIESHVCVLQTVHQLLENDFEVFIVHECVTSRCEKNRDWAIQRMTQEGAHMVSIESCFFEIMRSTAAPEFKAISRLIR